MTDKYTGSFDGRLVSAKFKINNGAITFSDVTLKELILGESLLTPGLQTAATLQSFIYTGDPKHPGQTEKDFGTFKNQMLDIDIATNDGNQSMTVSQKIYRIDNRKMEPSNIGQTEEFTVHACDQSLLNDAQSLVSKSWKCETPDSVVEYVLKSCAGVKKLVFDPAQPARDYIAENIHPFQVVAQQCNVALDNGDPSFLHYMTYENGGTHYFRSLDKLRKGMPVAQFFHSEGNMDLSNPNAAIAHSFPCDFDLLSDLLNGVDANGNNINSVGTINPFTGQSTLIGGVKGGCGIGSGNHKSAVTNKGSARQQNSCEIDVEKWLLLRQARMGLLEKDKIALRITVPWRPELHVGNVIGFNWRNKYTGEPVYGAGNYLVAALTHNIQFGGFASTTMDCIRRTY